VGPGATSVQGNERADQLAKEGAGLGQIPGRPLGRWPKRRDGGMQIYKGLNRMVVGRVLAARSAYRDFAIPISKTMYVLLFWRPWLQSTRAISGGHLLPAPWSGEVPEC
jgi:hypothetical protein